MKALLRKIRQILRDRKARRIFTRLVSTVAAIVVFVTTYALVLPAITMESEAACGIEAHQHDQSCYTDVLVCEIPESPGHVHDESCYSTKQKMVCQLEEHTHGSACYDEEGKLICGMAEHQHEEECFEEEQELVCEIQESVGHQHDDSCYQKVLTCGKEVHTHSSACYRVNAENHAATEAIAVASTESATAAAKDSVNENGLNISSENSAFESGLDASSEKDTLEGGLDLSAENNEIMSGSTSMINEVSADKTSTWSSAESNADPMAGTSASTSKGLTTDESTGTAASSESTAGETASKTTSSELTAGTTASTGVTTAAGASAGYVPVLDELDFDLLLNKHTGIYYNRPNGANPVADNETDEADSAADTGKTQEAAVAANTNEILEAASAEETGEAQEAAAWNKVDKHVELKESDNLRLYLAYTIPAGSLNETNQTARYRLPGNINLTDEQIDIINTTVNGIAAQYVSYDLLEILNQEMYGQYLGIEAVEGTRTPSDDLDEYLTNNAGQEFISATVKVENVFDENTGARKAQDLIFTFAPYTIQKNQHQYDSEGKPTKAGEEVNGWLIIDITTKQIDWEKADDETQAADIIFVEKDESLGLKEVSTELRLAGTSVDSDVHTEKDAEGIDADNTDSGTADNKQDSTKDGEAADAEPGNAEKETFSYPAVSFSDSIKVSGGALSTDTGLMSGNGGLAEETEITVRVEADKGTFPGGTTIVLSAVADDRMSAVAEAVEGAVDAPKTMGFHAVDISFRDAKGNEIEPLKPIRVSMTSDAIKRAVEDESTAPVVVHVSDPAADGTVQGRNTDDGNSESIDVPDAAKDVDEDDRHGSESSENTEKQTSENSPEASAAPAATIIETSTGTGEEQGDTLTFKAEEFSVYAIVYTVDFHWEVNGKMYDFSIPGGGFVSLEHLVEVLGIALTDENRVNEAENTENSTGDGDEFVGEVSGVEATDTYVQAIKLNEVEVSEATKKFVADVESVEFSSPELVWIGKADSVATVGGLKEAYELEVEYSAELTKEQIEEINAQTVEAGDWALISVQPFTSEETLTITMKNGDLWTVKVTDAQKPYKDVSTLVDGKYIIFRSDNSSSRFMFLKNDGTTGIIFPGNGQSLSASDLSAYTWTVTGNGNGNFTIKSTRGNRYINLYGNNNEYDKWSNNNWASVALSGSNGIAIAHNGKVLKRDDNGFFNATGTGVGLTFYKIEENSSGESAESPGIILTDSEREYFEKWEKTLENFNTLTDYDKTAEVLSEDQRMYKIDIIASSGITDFYKDVDLGFVLDISNSMQFPSSLKALENQNGNEYKAWMTAEELNAAKSAYANEYNKQGCFYIISDPALTSTIYRVYWDGRNWRYQDASELGNDNVYYINNGTVFKEPYRQSYTLYYADDTKKRFTYLQESVTNAINILHKIVKPTEHVDDETASVRVAYNLFASEIYESDSFKDLREQENNLLAIPLEYTKSGTRQDLALYDGDYNPANWWTSPDNSDLLSANEFGWDSDSDQYVILVTDGAPNGASMNDVRTAANYLKRQYPNIKIFTIGLSTKDVDGGSEMLYDIADTVGGVRQFYEAEKAQDLEYILLKILRTIMAEGLVKGKITDTIDRGFYPVDLQGNPLSAGVYKNGALVPNARISDYVSGGKPTNAHQNEAFYTWEQVGDEWKITWYNQSIGWDDNNSSTGNPWAGIVYVKAKEDYLGGNLIETNDGNAQIEPTGIKLVINGQPESNWRPLENMSPIDLPVPRVNVHNLESDQHSTTWTVYKGTSVTPKEQLEALWDNIPIEEVVNPSEGGQHKITSGSAANVGSAGEGEIFTLGSLMTEVKPSFNIDSLINDITTGNSSASTSFEYEAYGHKSGTIAVTVERTKGNKTPATHTLDTVGNEVEQYKVTFTYTPYPETQRYSMISAGWTEAEQEDYNENGYHNGSNGRGTEETDTITSINTHTINVFERKIQITKVNGNGDPITGSTAAFELYRVDTAGNAVEGLPAGKYIKVADLTTNPATGITSEVILSDPTKNIDTSATKTYESSEKTFQKYYIDGTEYYILETVPPTDYTKYDQPVKITLGLEDKKTPVFKDSDGNILLYNWNQEELATVTIDDSSDHVTVDAAGAPIKIRIQNDIKTDIDIIKTDNASTPREIGGAVFTLTKDHNVMKNLSIVSKTDNSTVEVNEETGEFTIPEGGVTIKDLSGGEYVLTELFPPAGYLKTIQDVEFSINGAGVITDSANAQNAGKVEFVPTSKMYKIKNEPGAALPNTGGPGTNLIYFLGFMFTSLSGVGLVMKRKRKAA